jgi:hypothetical protein
VVERLELCVSDFTGLPLPPGQLGNDSLKQSDETSVKSDGSFFVEGAAFFDATANAESGTEDRSMTFSPRPVYDEYLQMDKVLSRPNGVQKLVEVYTSLSQESMPRYLAVAGWAAAEAALMGLGQAVSKRKELLEGAADAWTRGLKAQLAINANRKHDLREPSQPLRLALDLAILPLLEGMVESNVTEDKCRRSFEASLEIANYNTECRLKARESGDIQAMQDYNGFSYELLCLLAINRRLSSSKIALPALARADSGHYLRHQSHDILAIHQQWGVIRNAVPIEIKGRTSSSDRRRYRALLIRGQTYLCQGGLSADETLGAIDAAYHTDDPDAFKVAEQLTQQVTDMVKEYSLGTKLDVRAPRSVTYFRDSARVLERFPGLQPGNGHLQNAQVS